MSDPFEIYQKIHFIGIGGIGISALARLLKHWGHQITGSDQTRNHNVDLLQNAGVTISIGHTATNLPPQINLVIYTSAIPKDNPELQAALDSKITTLTYAQAISKLTNQMDTTSICGTHGKTTITALIGYALSTASVTPSVIVGSLVREFGDSNLFIGNSNQLILESCEYQESFLNYHPKVIILNNIDPEHLDYFKTATNYINAFRKFITRLPTNGILIANGDDANIKSLLLEKPSHIRSFTFGRETSNDYLLEGKTIHLPSGVKHTFALSIPGDHNLLNAAAVIAYCDIMKHPLEPILHSLAKFTGAARRLELKGTFHDLPIYDDYGHAPAEIRATLRALKSKYGEKSRILCVFQPHQYSRTRLFLEEFARSFQDAKLVLIPNIYKSRDSIEDMASINVDMLVTAINTHQPNLSTNSHNFSETESIITANYADYDLILTIGAGDITRLSDLLAKSPAHHPKA